MKTTMRDVIRTSIARYFVILVTLAGFISGAAAAAINDDRVTVSIHPVHSIVAYIMQGIAEPTLLINNTQSAHHTSLKPSQAKILSATELLFWVGPQMEAGLSKPINSLSHAADRVVILKNKYLKIIETSDGSIDPHIWLSLKNAILIADIAVEKLTKLDPDNQQAYRGNLQKFESDISDLEQEISSMLAATKPVQFLIYHDSLRYFSRQFGVQFVALSKGSEEIAPSAKQIVAIGKLLRTNNYSCIFVEAGEDAQRLNAVNFSGSTKQIIFDPLGAEYAQGPELYFNLLRGLASKISDCALGN